MAQELVKKSSLQITKNLFYPLLSGGSPLPPLLLVITFSGSGSSCFRSVTVVVQLGDIFLNYFLKRIRRYRGSQKSTVSVGEGERAATECLNQWGGVKTDWRHCARLGIGDGSAGILLST